ncbi:polyketide synthase [Colletotrichum tofieldiae]|uniref:Polyketide synthase n=1 Tax=Colletotrichum tofieldiae TaxID=708197 RepID=A0A161W4I9_9PEZI|nr:polyketide synthase [Colletotrichum tofieldiae]
MTQGLSAVDSVLPPHASVKVYGVGPSLHIPTLCAYLESKGKRNSGRIAIVGISGRYPRSRDLEEFWEKICKGKALHTELYDLSYITDGRFPQIPLDRFSLDDYYNAINSTFTTNTKYRYFLDNPGLFNIRFFNLSPRKAIKVDPAHQLFLLTVFKALKTTGYSRRPHTKTEACQFATFVGQIANDWAKIFRLRGSNAFSLTGNQRSFAASRVNYHFK